MKHPVTLNRIIDFFKDVTYRHPMLNDFGFGPEPDFGAKPVKFPLLWMIPATGSMTIGPNTTMANYAITVFVADRINKGNENFADAMTDCDSIVNSIVTEFRQAKYTRENQITLTSVDKVFDTYQHDEDVNGVLVTFNITFPSLINICNTPIRPGYCVTPTVDPVPDTPVIPDPSEPQ